MPAGRKGLQFPGQRNSQEFRRHCKRTRSLAAQGGGAATEIVPWPTPPGSSPGGTPMHQGRLPVAQNLRASRRISEVVVQGVWAQDVRFTIWVGGVIRRDKARLAGRLSAPPQRLAMTFCPFVGQESPREPCPRRCFPSGIARVVPRKSEGYPLNRHDANFSVQPITSSFRSPRFPDNGGTTAIPRSTD